MRGLNDKATLRWCRGDVRAKLTASQIVVVYITKRGNIMWGFPLMVSPIFLCYKIRFCDNCSLF